MYRTGDSGWLDARRVACISWAGWTGRSSCAATGSSSARSRRRLLAIEGVTQAAARKVELQGQAGHPCLGCQHPRERPRTAAAGACACACPTTWCRRPLPSCRSCRSPAAARSTTTPCRAVAPSLPVTAGRGPANQREADLLALWETELGRKSAVGAGQFLRCRRRLAGRDRDPGRRRAPVAAPDSAVPADRKPDRRAAGGRAGPAGDAAGHPGATERRA